MILSNVVKQQNSIVKKNKTIEKKYGLEFKELTFENGNKLLISVDKKKKVIDVVDVTEKDVKQELTYLLGKHHKIPEKIKKQMEKKRKAEEVFNRVSSVKEKRQKLKLSDTSFKKGEVEDLTFLSLILNKSFYYLLSNGIIDKNTKEVIVNREALTLYQSIILQINRVLSNTVRTHGVIENSVKVDIIESYIKKYTDIVDKRFKGKSVYINYFVMYMVLLYIEQVEDKVVKVSFMSDMNIFYETLNKIVDDPAFEEEIKENTEKAAEAFMIEVYKDRQWIKENWR